MSKALVSSNAQGSGMKNRIINGGMDISQRGTSFANPTPGTYTVDRWRTENSTDGAITITQNSDVPSSNEFQNSLRLTVTTADTSIAAGQWELLAQYIEGYNIRDLIGRTFTLSFWVRSSKIGTHCVAFCNAGGDRTYVSEYSIISANAWEYKTITVAGGLPTAGTWNYTNGIGLQVRFAIATGTTYQSTIGWSNGNYVSTSNQVNCLDTIGNIFAITGVQLEAGAVATPFEHRLYGQELMLCQRYYEKSYDQSAVPGTNTSTGAKSAFTHSTSVATGFNWVVQKRAGISPGTNLTLYSLTGTVDTSSNSAGTNVGVSSSGMGDAGMSGCRYLSNSSANWTAGQIIYFHYAVSAEL